MIVVQNNFKMGYISGSVPPHAASHGAEGNDPITWLAAFTANSIVYRMGGIPFAPSIALDLSQYNHFSVGELTANIAITWSNPNWASNGSVLVKQDAVGGRTVTLTPPAGYVLQKTTADLTAATAPNAYTLYSWTFLALFPTAFLIVTKQLPVAAP